MWTEQLQAGLTKRNRTARVQLWERRKNHLRCAGKHRIPIQTRCRINTLKHARHFSIGWFLCLYHHTTFNWYEPLVCRVKPHNSLSVLLLVPVTAHSLLALLSRQHIWLAGGIYWLWPRPSHLRKETTWLLNSLLHISKRINRTYTSWTNGSRSMDEYLTEKMQHHTLH